MSHNACFLPAPSLRRQPARCSWLSLGAAVVVVACAAGCADEHKDSSTAAASASSSAATIAAEASQTITCRGKAGVTAWTTRLMIKGSSNTITFATVQPPNAAASATASPAQGNNTFVVEVKDLAGAAVADGTIELVSTMPEHSHPPPPAVSAKIAAGKATLPQVQLFMSGLWSLKFTVQPTGKTADTAELSICLEG